MTSLKVISWTWYSFVSLIIVVRYIARTMHLGSIKRLQVDDGLMLLAFATYTVDIVFLNIVAVTPTNLFPPGTDITTFTAEDYSIRIYGSRMTVLVEQMQCLTIWTVKACLLIMYLRIISRRVERMYMMALAVYTGVTFVIMEILYLGVWCRPLTEYWAVPTDNIQCSAATNHLITNMVFNLTSDILLLCIALPIFIKTQMATRQKAAICLVFGLGVFTIIAAILNKYYSFTNPFGSEWVQWYCHESSTNMVVANLPFAYNLFRRVRSKVQSNSGTRSYQKGSKMTGAATKGATLMSKRGGGTIMEDEIPFKNQPVTIVTDINIVEERQSVDDLEQQTYHMNVIAGKMYANKTTVTGNSDLPKAPASVMTSNSRPSSPDS